MNDKAAVRWADDGTTHGEVLKDGLVGLRQMAHTGSCTYTRFRVYAVAAR